MRRLPGLVSYRDTQYLVVDVYSLPANVEENGDTTVLRTAWFWPSLTVDQARIDKVQHTFPHMKRFVKWSAHHITKLRTQPDVVVTEST